MIFESNEDIICIRYKKKKNQRESFIGQEFLHNGIIYECIAIEDDNAYIEIYGEKVE